MRVPYVSNGAARRRKEVQRCIRTARKIDWSAHLHHKCTQSARFMGVCMWLAGADGVTDAFPALMVRDHDDGNVQYVRRFIQRVLLDHGGEDWEALAHALEIESVFPHCGPRCTAPTNVVRSESVHVERRGSDADFLMYRRRYHTLRCMRAAAGFDARRSDASVRALRKTVGGR